MFYVFDHLYDILYLHDLLSCRGVCKYWNCVISYICYTTKCVPLLWTGYANMNGLVRLFPNVDLFPNLGHRGCVTTDVILNKVHRLWLDARRINHFEVLMFCKNVNNIKRLTINIGCDVALLNAISCLEWTHLEHLYLITLTMSMCKTPMNWKTPHLKRIALGVQYNAFPLCLNSLPIKNIEELLIINCVQMNTIAYPQWVYGFANVWPGILLSNMSCIRLHHVIPDSEMAIHALIDALHPTNIQEVQLVPCSAKNAVLFLSSTRITLVTERKGLRMRWELIKYAYADRLQFC